MLAMMDKSKFIILSILVLVIAFAIINTMFMSLYERTFEFAVLRAMGTHSRHILVLVMFESILLGALGCLIGMGLALFFAAPLWFYGLNYQGMELGETTITKPIYYVFSLEQYTVFPLIIIFFVAIVSLYPAIHAVRLSILQAITRKG